MKLRGTLTIDFEAEDFIDAAEKQKRLQEVVDALKDEFPEASLFIGGRREPPKKPAQRSRKKTAPDV